MPKGSYLLVENLDRVSRDEITESLPLFFDLHHRRHHRRNAHEPGSLLEESGCARNQYAIYGIINELIRANQESFL